MDKASLLAALGESGRTLFLPHPGTTGYLVLNRGGKRSAVVRQFAGSQAAMAWCESTRTALVYWHDHPSRGN